MYHYVYAIIRNSVFDRNDVDTPWIYIGVRSSKQLPNLDSYMGSGKILKLDNKEEKTKIILGVYESRAVANGVERILVNEEFIKSPSSYNLVVGGSTFNDVEKLNTSEIIKKLWQIKEYRDKHNNLDYLHTDEIKEKVGDTIRKRFEIDPSLGEEISKRMVVKWEDPEYRAKQNNLEYLHTDEIVEKRNQSIREYYSTDDAKEGASVRAIARWEDPEYRAKQNNLEYLHTDEVREKIRAAATKQFSTPLVCPTCGHVGRGPWMYQKHFNNCKSSVNLTI